MRLLMSDYWNMLSSFMMEKNRVLPIGSFRLFFHVNFWCTSSISLQYFSAVMVLPGFIKLWWIKPAEDHQTVIITFFWWSFGFIKCCGVLSASSYWAELLRLSYIIYFTSQVTIRLRKVSFCFEEEGQTKFQSVCVYVSHSIHEEPIYSYFSTLPN